MVEIKLEPVAEQNYIKCLKLSVSEDQKDFVATNSKSLAQAYVFKNLSPYVAMVGEEAVGFIMLEVDKHVGFVMRLMVDQERQREGIGRAIMEQGLAILRADDRVTIIGTSHVEENSTVASLYSSLGFVPWDDIRDHFDDFEDDGEVYLKLS